MNEKVNENSWIPLMIVACATFIIAVDTSFMNVSISQIAADLNTANIIIQNAMAFVMQVLAIILGVILILTMQIKDKNNKKQ